ncbi:AraC family transcriptional regulator [Paenibacillus cremeus]|uniref:AraC family transcriptional regulator n=1 Tax=Paenibacillus cremeus TaxID=2163881 RepID=A0A559KD97_9BACL|nr:AraC family transcriptional regulator [Paenibacillus cremeus]TVY10074.1 AraC family transcriptional regulator [Paenibacillus cremeus]
MRHHKQLPTLNDHEYLILPESVGWYWDFPEHSVYRAAGSLNNFSIHLVLDGKGYVQTEKITHTLQRGDAFLYFPMQEQRYWTSDEEPWNVRWVHFYGKPLTDYMREKDFHLSPLWTMRQWKPLEQALDQLLTEVEENAFLQLPRLSTLTYAALTEFVANAIPHTSSKSIEIDQRILDLLPTMRNSACQPFELDYWAEQAGVSTYYFCKLFKKATQMTPMTFITLSRLQFSKQWLLENKELTVREIALQAGYPSVSYFNKRFLEQEGMTPTDYRELYHKD